MEIHFYAATKLELCGRPSVATFLKPIPNARVSVYVCAAIAFSLLLFDCEEWRVRCCKAINSGRRTKEVFLKKFILNAAIFCLFPFCLLFFLLFSLRSFAFSQLRRCVAGLIRKCKRVSAAEIKSYEWNGRMD